MNEAYGWDRPLGHQERTTQARTLLVSALCRRTIFAITHLMHPGLQSVPPTPSCRFAYRRPALRDITGIMAPHKADRALRTAMPAMCSDPEQFGLAPEISQSIGPGMLGFARWRLVPATKSSVQRLGRPYDRRSTGQGPIRQHRGRRLGFLCREVNRFGASPTSQLPYSER